MSVSLTHLLLFLAACLLASGSREWFGSPPLLRPQDAPSERGSPQRRKLQLHATAEKQPGRKTNELSFLQSNISLRSIARSARAHDDVADVLQADAAVELSARMPSAILVGDALASDVPAEPGNGFQVGAIAVHGGVVDGTQRIPWGQPWQFLERTHGGGLAAELRLVEDVGRRFLTTHPAGSWVIPVLLLALVATVLSIYASRVLDVVVLATLFAGVGFLAAFPVVIYLTFATDIMWDSLSGKETCTYCSSVAAWSVVQTLAALAILLLAPLGSGQGPELPLPSAPAKLFPPMNVATAPLQWDAMPSEAFLHDFNAQGKRLTMEQTAEAQRH